MQFQLVNFKGTSIHDEARYN